MRFTRWAVSAVLAAAGAAFGAPEAKAADPVVLGVAEAEAPDGGGRVLVVYGLLVQKISAYQLLEPGAIPIAPLTLLFKSKNVATLAIPPGVAAPTYTVPGPFILRYTYKSTTTDLMITITNGAPTVGSVNSGVLAPALLTDLNDAATVGGETPADLRDWNSLVNVPSGFADGVDDGVTFGGNGMATTASRSDHEHDARYYSETELNVGDGTVNQAGDPIDWTRIKNIPAAFADGVDDGGSAYLAGSGLLLAMTTFSANFTSAGGDAGSGTTVARGDHIHDGRYFTETELTSTGTINTGSNPVDWTRLKGVPAGFADGTDEGAAYTAGTGILIGSGAISANFAGTGSAGTVSRSDHNHTGTYLPLTGGTLSGTLTISTSGQAISATSGTSGAGVESTTSAGTGVRGSGDVGVLGDCDSDGLSGVLGITQYSYQTGVLGYTNNQNSIAVEAYQYYTYRKYGNALLVRNNYGFASEPVEINLTGRYNTGLVLNMTDSSYYYGPYKNYANFIMCRNNGNDFARIDLNGAGFFNGGTYAYGADFAESVRVDRPVEEFEPGDVLVIDPSAPRQFALSREAESPLVAGVISTKPALVGTTHNVARQEGGKESAWKKSEVKLGVVGIVPTKVCDEGGPIRIGNLLVTASIPGHAKKAPPSPAAGTLIGKALGALERGRGKVEVLLMAR